MKRTAEITNPKKTRKDTPAARFYEKGCGEWLLWVGMIGAPVLWAIQFQTTYSLTMWVCRTGHLHVLQMISAVFLFLAIGAGGLSFWNWRHIGAKWPGSKQEGVGGRSRFMALIGIFTSVIFSMLIIAQAMAMFIIDPCEF